MGRWRLVRWIHINQTCVHIVHNFLYIRTYLDGYINVVRPSFPMMTITSSMMMMMSCLVDPVGAEVANQSNYGLQHSSTLGAWVCRAG